MPRNLARRPARRCVRRDRRHHLELDLDRVGQELGGLGVVAMGAAGRLGHDRIDDAQGEARLGGRAQRRRRPLAPRRRPSTGSRRSPPARSRCRSAFCCISTRSATPIASAPPDEPSPITHATTGTRQAHERELRAGDRAGLAALLGADAGGGAGGVDQRHDREAQPAGEREHPHRLAVALGARHAEVAVGALLQVAALLVSHEGHRLAAERPDAGHDRRGRRASARSPCSSRKSSQIRPR